MPMKSGSRSFPTMADMVKREDEIRRASVRAEARMTHGMSQAGGLEGAKRYSLAVHKFQEEQVKQELYNIQNAYKRNNILMMSNPENLKHADPRLAEDLEEEESKSETAVGEQENRKAPKDYGRNFFGYKSQPGSNKPHFEQIRHIKDKYSNVKNYYEYKGPKRMDKQTRKKLDKQRRANMSVEEKVKSFAAPEKPKVAGYQAPVSLAKTTAKNKTEDKQQKEPPVEKNQKDEEVDASQRATERTSIGGLSVRRKTKEISQPPIEPLEVKPNEEVALPDLRIELDETPVPLPPVEQPSRRVSRRSHSPATSSQRNFDTASTIGSTLTLPPHRTTKPKTALDLVFDADTYAPDGRLRTVHTLPAFDKAFKEAKQARYVRTKYKRDVEKELSVNEIFGR